MIKTQRIVLKRPLASCTSVLEHQMHHCHLRHQSQFKFHCYFSKRTFFQSPKTLQGAQFRVAIVGAGASGMSTALHLAPLAERGLIAKPIDIYEKYNDNKNNTIHPESKSQCNDDDENFHPGSGHIGRDVGIGIWNTALEPFLHKASSSSASSSPTSTSHQLLKALEDKGQYVGNVGYRTPSGRWLTRGELNQNGVLNSSALPSPCQDSTDGDEDGDSYHDQPQQHIDPALLFIREKDFLGTLREAVMKEEKENQTIKIHYDTTVQDIVLPSSSSDILEIASPSREDAGHIAQLQFTDGALSPAAEPYHLIIAADGMHSSLRQNYTGYSSLDKKIMNRETVGNNPNGNDARIAKKSEEWNRQTLEERNAIEDRKYTVFRGNSPLGDSEAGMDGSSFQTWGEGHSMRFAAIGMSHPSDDGGDQKVEKQVWFATISDCELSSTKDAEERKKLLLSKFSEWHEPISSLIGSTPAEEILMERAVAHKHSLYPVLNLSEVIYYQKHYRHSPLGPGPPLLITGDAAMTVDPVLAQGFTIAMEAAADFANTLETCLSDEKTINHSALTGLPFDPIELRNALKLRNERRYGRMLCLLRATELVQTMAQPNDAMTGLISKKIIRPAMMIVPCFVKKAVFNYVMKYSLGYFENDSAPADKGKER